MNRTLSMRCLVLVTIALAASVVEGANFPVNKNLALVSSQITGFGEQRWASGPVNFTIVRLTAGDTATIRVTFDKILRIQDTLASEDEFIYFRVGAAAGPGGGFAQELNYRWVWIAPVGDLQMADPFFGTGCLSGINGVGVITLPGVGGCQNIDGVLDITDDSLEVCGIELRILAPPGVTAAWNVTQIRFALQADEISIVDKPDEIPTLSTVGTSTLILVLLFVSWITLRRQRVG